MYLRKLFFSLIALALLAGTTTISQAGSADADCAEISIPVDDACCANAADTSACSTDCVAATAALVPAGTACPAPMDGSARFERVSAHGKTIAWPPDTAPPK